MFCLLEHKFKLFIISFSKTLLDYNHFKCNFLINKEFVQNISIDLLTINFYNDSGLEIKFISKLDERLKIWTAAGQFNKYWPRGKMFMDTVLGVDWKKNASDSMLTEKPHFTSKWNIYYYAKILSFFTQPILN